MALFRLLALLMAVVGGFGFILYQVLKFTTSINNPAGLAKRDGSRLRKEIAPYLTRLVPMTDSEFELFSLNNEMVTSKRSGFKLTKGVFHSIYHEPLMAFAYKQYKNKNVATLLASTVDDEYFYISMNGETQVFHNGNALGLILPTGELRTPDRKQLLAHISPEDVLKLHPITINNREVGQVLNPLETDKISPRAFQYLEHMNDNEKVLFMSLSFLSLVEESL